MTRPAPRTRSGRKVKFGSALVQRTFGWFFAPATTIQREYVYLYGVLARHPESLDIPLSRKITEAGSVTASGSVPVMATGTAISSID